MNSPLSHNNNRNNSIIWVIPVLFLLIVMSSKNLFALEDSKNLKDSTRKTFPEVKVYANKISDNKLIEFSSNSNITKSEIEKLTSLQLSEVLSYLPGMYIKDYGGLGGLKTISLRGTLANQTILMLNGVRLNSNQNGISDLGNLPISMIENIEVIRSGMSSQYGSGAIVGAVNLTLSNNQKDGYSASASLGSFNENLLSISAKKNYSGINFGTSIEYKHSDGTYPLAVKHFGEESEFIRSNNSMTNISATMLSGYQTENFLLNFLILASTSKRGVPGAVLQGYIESRVSKLDEQSILIALNTENSFSNDLLFKAGINTKTNNLNYSDAEKIGIGGGYLDNNFYSVDHNFNLGIEKKYENTKLYFLTDAVISNLNGDMLQPEVAGKINRNNLGIALGAENKLDILEFVRLNFVANIRTDFFNDNEPSISPFLGINIFPVKTNFSFKANISSNFRMPSFNELYYLNYGTSNLKPERSNSLNLSMNYKYENLILEVNGFLINTKDLIVSIPKSPISWSAQNIGESLNQGIELIASYKSENNKFRIIANYTIQQAKDITNGSLNYDKLLVYVPQEMLNLNISYNLLDIDFISNFNYVSFRYSLMSNDINSVLPDYYTLSFRISKEFNFDSDKLTAAISADNITNEQFSIVKNFPMPGTIYRLSLNYKFKNADLF